MKKVFFLLLLFLPFCGSIVAETRLVQNDQSSIVLQQRKTRSTRTGLYTRKLPAVRRGVGLTFNALYYYGDVDMLGVAFKEGWQPQNLSLGGSVKFDYLHQIGRTTYVRASILGGYLHGNDSARTELNSAGVEVPIGKGSFRNIFGELSAGVEWYPFTNAGFYTYLGLGVSLNVIDYDFSRIGYGPDRMVNVVPMLPFEIGYNFEITKGFCICISASVHEALIDVPHCNLDAYPINKSSRFQWGDGYFALGISFSYRWQECAPCRLAQL